MQWGSSEFYRSKQYKVLLKHVDGENEKSKLGKDGH